MISFRSGQSGQHAHTRRAFDFYSTPAIAVEALLKAERFVSNTRVWEPAAGDGAIAHAFRAHGFPVICSDIVERAFPLHFTGDFFTQSKAPAGCTTIITNPPYRNATEFAQHALELLPDVYLLLRLAFYESVRRTELLEHRGLRVVHVFPPPSAANAPPRLERSAQLELDRVRLVCLAPQSSRSADSQPHLNRTGDLEEHTHSDTHRAAGSVWTLSDGTTVNPTSPRSSPPISTSWARVTACSRV